MTGPKLDKFLSTFRIESPEKICYNSTNLVFFDPDDYSKVKSVFGKKLEDVIKIEINEFNTYVYIVRYINIEFLTKLIEGIN